MAEAPTIEPIVRKHGFGYVNLHGGLIAGKLRVLRNLVAKEWSIESFTCDGCGGVNICKYAFDGYNTDGDCLAEK
jgi:hypothetical protein